MGLLRFALVGNYKRFYNDLKEVSKTNKKSPIIMFIDTAICTVLLGSGLQDYLNYKFYEKSFKERKTYVTIGNMAKAYKKLASIEYAEFFSNKVNFHTNFNKYTKRDFLSPEESFDDFKAFIEKHPTFVMKPISGLGGTSITKMNIKDIQYKREFFDKLRINKCFLEELIIQDEVWGSLSPNSVNTLRVMTTAINRKIKDNFCSC